MTQAVIRGLPNAIGIDTKKDRGTSANSYLTDKDFEWFKNHIDTQIQKAKDSGKTIVIPADGIGTGKAILKEKAPKLFEYLQQELNKLKQQITPQQKQQAQQQYSQYLEQNPNGSVEQFKSWVDKFNRHKDLLIDKDSIADEITEKAFLENPSLSKIFTKEEYKNLVINHINKRDSEPTSKVEIEEKIIDGKKVKVTNKVLPTSGEITDFINSLNYSNKKEVKIAILNYVINSTNNPKLVAITKVMLENIDLIADFSFIGFNYETRSRTALAKINPTNGEISLFKGNLLLFA
jgi:hypothetical protein